MSTIDYTNISDEEYIEISSRVLASWASKTLEPVIYGSGASRALKDLKKKAAGFFAAMRDHFSREHLNRKRALGFFAAMRDHFSREHLNRKRALAIGFKPWSEDAPKLLLIPLWYCGMLKDGQEVVTIGGSIEKYSRETTDHDMRFGVVPFGFEFEDPRKDAQAQDGGEAMTHKWICPFCTGKLKAGRHGEPMRKCQHPDKKEKELYCMNSRAYYKWCKKRDYEMPWICAPGVKAMTGRRVVE